MAERELGYNATLAVVVLLMLAALAVAAWRLGLFERGSAEDERGEYKIGVTDESGGELIVADPATPQIEDLELPKTPMTPGPPGEDARDASRAGVGTE